jgi:hypothetical protein
VFDEVVFPFQSLNPNAGALLRQEILLLPPTLLNPEKEKEDAFINDTHMTNIPTNPASSLVYVAPQVPMRRTLQSGENSAQNSAPYTENNSSEQSNSTEHGADSLL